MDPGWDRDRSTAVGIEQWRPRLAAQCFDARDGVVVEGRHLLLARLCGFDIGRQLAPFFAVTQLVARQRQRIEDTWFQTGRFDYWTVAVAEVGPGNARAATIAVRALTHFKPEIAAFVGIAGGVKDVALGDVVVGTKIYSYESGKETPEGFRIRPDVQISHHELEQRARVLRPDTNWHSRLDPNRSDADQDTQRTRTTRRRTA